MIKKSTSSFKVFSTVNFNLSNLLYVTTTDAIFILRTPYAKGSTTNAGAVCFSKNRSATSSASFIVTSISRYL